MASQLTLSFASDELSPPVVTPAAPPTEISKEGLLWVHVEPVPRRKRGGKTSKIWSIGDKYTVIGMPTMVAWRCQLCTSGDSLITLTNGSSSPVLRHLMRKHRDYSAADFDDSSDITTMVSDASCGATYTSLTTTININDWRHFLLQWVVKRQIPFDEVEDDDFQAMLLSLSQSVKPYLVQSSQTIRNWVHEEYMAARLQIKQVLVESQSQIHVSFDLWTSPNGYALCAVCAHFVGHNIRNTTVLLGLKRMMSSHCGEAISEVIVPILREYDVAPKLGVFVTDNAESNDTAIKAILSEVRPDLAVFPRRARCLGHIINLAAKAFLFGTDVEAFETIVDQVSDDTAWDSKVMRDSQVAWRKKGVIGRFHNLTVFIRSSPQRREAFKRCTIGDGTINNLMVIQDNSTRWNLTYHSIHRGLKLQRRLTLYCNDYSDDLGPDCIHKDDWTQLQEVVDALEPFHEATMRTQGNAGNGHHGAVWEVLPTLEALLEVMEQGKAYYTPQGKVKPPPIAIAYQNAWDKLKKYYNLTNRSHIYTAAVLFNPMRRKAYFDDQWTSDEMVKWKDTMISNTRRIWNQDYNTMAEQVPLRVKQPDFLDKYLQRPSQIQVDSDSVFDAYISAMPTYCAESDQDLLGWWNQPTNQYRPLRQLAFDLISIPAMSAECERVFSSAKRMIPSDRNRLSNETIEMLQLLKNWWGHHIVAPMTTPPLERYL